MNAPFNYFVPAQIVYCLQECVDTLYHIKKGSDVIFIYIVWLSEARHIIILVIDEDGRVIT